MNTAHIASISVMDQAIRDHYRFPHEIEQSRATDIQVAGSVVSFNWGGRRRHLSTSACLISYEEKVAEFTIELNKAPAATAAASAVKAKPKGKPGRKPGFRPASKKPAAQADHVAVAAGAKRTNGAAVTAN